MRLADPFWLILLALIPLPWLLSRWRSGLAWPTLDGFRGNAGRVSTIVRATVPLALRGLAIACVAVALARPQSVSGRTRIAGQGVTIIVALDQSSSMSTVDFPGAAGTPNLKRLDAAQAALTGFVAGRPDDLIGLVVFANYPDLACPPTLDHEFLVETVRAVRSARPGDDGTNLGDAMALALEALKESDTRKKVLVLLTDGRNSPAVPKPTDPEAAARIARGLGITIHTLAVGPAVEPASKQPLPTPGESEGPDLALLERIATLGGGRAFVATDPKALERVFAEIDLLEKSAVRGEVRTRYREHFAPWAVAALGMIVADRLLATGRSRRLP